MEFDFYFYAGIIMALIGAVCLMRIGYEGGYFFDFIISFLFQLLFVAGCSLALYGRGMFRNEYLYAAIGISFAWPLLGRLIFEFPWLSRQHKEKSTSRRLNNAIKNGRKYKDYIAFVNAHADSIGLITNGGTVIYAPAGIPLFTTTSNGYEETVKWNPALGRPRSSASGGWQQKRFFTIEADERAWTSEEGHEIASLIRQSLPGGIEKWSYDSEDQFYIRMVPKGRRIKARKDPY